MKTRSIHAISFLLSMLLLMTCICPLLTPSASAVSASSIRDVLFDADYYKSHNPDVVKAYGTSASALRRHFDDYGAREGRRPSVLFDASWYLGCYPDLKAAFGNDYAAALNHFVTYGIAEGRQGSPEFNVSVYKANYPDLRQAFGTDLSNNWKYLRHYLQYGQSENRNAVSPLSGSAVSSGGTTMYVKTSSTANRLNLRSAASTSSTILAKLPYGTAVQVLSSSNGWSKVQADGKTGYVSSQYLSSAAPGTSTVSARQQAMADKALSMLGNSNYNGLCQRFVRVVGESIGLPSGNAASALDACNMWRVSTSRDNIPVGAAVYLRSKNTAGAGYKYGHVGIYVGDGYVVHALSTVRKQSLDSLLQSYTYLGWGWQSGVDLR